MEIEIRLLREKRITFYAYIAHFIDYFSHIVAVINIKNTAAGVVEFYGCNLDKRDISPSHHTVYGM